ncbi:hypothetical protein LCGC14_1381190 [marine sediment metagenome]|uniref:Uncharacterized protein n=1 Tax=marine sediment metagenome TaxID=412755 RepID=A0A0F9K304_9ZZZZ
MLETFQQEIKITEKEKTKIVRHFTEQFRDRMTEKWMGQKLWHLWEDKSPNHIVIAAISTLDILKILYKMRNGLPNVGTRSLSWLRAKRFTASS